MKEREDIDDEAPTKSHRRSSWILYILLIFCRVVVSAFLPGYVHPDEFFQGGQELWFGCPPYTPWEFHSQNALRSVFPPTIMTWLPLRVYAFITSTNMYNLSGREILVVPRIFCGLLSIVTVDLSVWCLTFSSLRKEGVPAAVLVVASAWPSLVLLNRPFTNTLETILLALLLSITNLHHGYHTDFITAILCALGLFTRFTFVFVAVPTVLQYLTDKTSLPVSRALLGILIMAIGFLVTCAGIIYSDVSYYKGSDSWISYVTPLNALLYNSKVENLKEHGLHPRWTHAVVNMLLLYGPLALMFYEVLAKKIVAVFTVKTAKKAEPSKSTMLQSRIRTTCLWTVVSGLGFLSLAPHQEPRFLLPLLVPLAILSQHCWRSVWVRCIWIAFNAILLLVYGILHQGGVIPSLFATSTITTAREVSRAVFYYHTYMPPTFASRIGNVDIESCSASIHGDEIGDEYCSVETHGCGRFPIIDLKGSSDETLLSSLNEHLLCSQGQESRDGHVYLVSPPLRMGDLAIGSGRCSLGASYSCRHIQHHWPHLTTEDFPPFDGSIGNMLSSLELSVYEIACQDD